MKIIKRILMGLVILIALLVIFRNPLIKMGVSAGMKAVVGMKLDIQKLDLNLGKSLIHIEDIKLYNPKDFPDPLMADVGKIYVDVGLAQFLKGQILIKDLQFDLKEFVVVKNKDGEVNLDRLKAVADSQDKEGEPKAEKPETKKGDAPEVNIENLHLKIGKVVFKDYSKGTEPSVKEFVLNLDEKHQDIKNLNAVVSLIVVKVLTKTTIGQLTNIDISGLQDIVGGTLQGVVGGATQTLGTTTDVLKGTTEGVGNKLKSIFGNK